MVDFCDDNQMLAGIIIDWVLPIIYSGASTTLILPAMIYCHAYIKGESKSTKKLFYMGLALYTTIFIILNMDAVRLANYCHPERSTVYRSLFPYFMILFWIQSGLVFLILFYRIYYIFNGTPFELNKLTIILWIALFIFTTILWFAGLIARYNANIPVFITNCIMAIGGLCSAGIYTYII